MGHKYWVAYEVRCMDTEKRLLQNQMLHIPNKVSTDEDINSIETFLTDQYHQQNATNGSDFLFKVTMTCWPHYLGKVEMQPIINDQSQDQKDLNADKVNPHKLQLVINNTATLH